MQEFWSCEIPLEFLGVSRSYLVVLRNSHFAGSTLGVSTNPLLQPPPPPKLVDRLLCREPWWLCPWVPVRFPCCPLSPELEEQSPREYRHRSLRLRYQLLTQNSTSLVLHIPPPTHICCCLDAGHFHCVFIAFLFSYVHVRSIEMSTYDVLHLHWGPSTELCRYGPSSHGVSI